MSESENFLGLDADPNALTDVDPMLPFQAIAVMFASILATTAQAPSGKSGFVQPRQSVLRLKPEVVGVADPGSLLPGGTVYYQIAEGSGDLANINTAIATSIGYPSGPIKVVAQRRSGDRDDFSRHAPDFVFLHAGVVAWFTRDIRVRRPDAPDRTLATLSATVRHARTWRSRRGEAAVVARSLLVALAIGGPPV